MSKAIEEFLERLKKLRENYNVDFWNLKPYPCDEFNCELALLFKNGYEHREQYLQIFKEIFEKPYFELKHPVYNHITTRAIVNFVTQDCDNFKQNDGNGKAYCNYIYFVDESNQYPWIAFSLYSLCDIIFTQTKIYVNPQFVVNNTFHNWVKWLGTSLLPKNNLQSLGIKRLEWHNVESTLLLSHSRPYHYFFEDMFWFFEMKLQKKITFVEPIKPFFISKTMKTPEELKKTEVGVYPRVMRIPYVPNYNFIELIKNEALEDIETLISQEDKEYQADLTLWLGIPGERRTWLESLEGICSILKNICIYFPKIKVYIDGMTSFDKERVEIPANKKTFETIKAEVDKLGLDIKMKSLAGYDYRTKICYCSMCDIVISETSTTSLVPFIFCKKGGVAFYCKKEYKDSLGSFDFIPHLKFLDEKYLLNDNIKGTQLFDYHIPPEHIYNLAAEALEELKNIKMHRLDVPPVELYAKKYELEKKTQIKFNNDENTKALLKNIKNQKMLLEIDNLILDKELKTLQIDEAKHNIELKTLQIKQLQVGYTKLVVRDDLPSAKARIQNHLSYKLGSIMIRNSKSLFGLFKLPYLLMAMTLAHKEQEKAYKEKIKTNPNLALPPLESYADYKEALKEKECFTYKLGSAFMKACKTWYKGGLVKFYFEAKALERRFKAKIS